MHMNLYPCILPSTLAFVLAVSAAPTSNSITHVPFNISIPKHKPTIFPTPTLQIFPTHAPLVTYTRAPEPTRTRGSQSGKPQRSQQTPIVIFFEALSGIAGLILFMSLLRFFYSYKKTPDRDRVSDIINRHRLQMELEQLHRRPPVRRASLQEPAPPYIPRPPSYVQTPTASTRALQAEISNRSSPDSPASSHASLEMARPLVSAPSHALPSG